MKKFNFSYATQAKSFGFGYLDGLSFSARMPENVSKGFSLALREDLTLPVALRDQIAFPIRVETFQNFRVLTPEGDVMMLHSADISPNMHIFMYLEHSVPGTVASIILKLEETYYTFGVEYDEDAVDAADTMDPYSLGSLDDLTLDELDARPLGGGIKKSVDWLLLQESSAATVLEKQLRAEMSAMEIQNAGLHFMKAVVLEDLESGGVALNSSTGRRCMTLGEMDDMTLEELDALDISMYTYDDVPMNAVKVVGAEGVSAGLSTGTLAIEA